MNKKVVIIFTVTLVSLLVIMAMYYGYDRCMILRLCSDNRAQKLIENYSKLPPVSENRTVITFASKDGNNIFPTVMSLLDQTTKVNQIALNSCLKNQPSETCLKAINVFRVSPKMEQFRGIVPTLEREKDARTNIIWLRDDRIYGKDFIETIVDKHKEMNRAVMAKDSRGEFVGVILTPDLLKTEIIDYENHCNQKNNEKNCNDISSIEKYLIDKPVIMEVTETFKV